MELFKLLGTIAIDTDAAESALDNLSRKTGATRTEIETAVNKIGTVALGIGKAFVTTGAALGGAWIAAIEGSREYRAEMAKLDTAFVTNGHSSQAAKQTYSDLNAVLGDSEQAVEASQHLAKLTEDEKQLQTWTDICTGVYATFGASLPIESLTESSNEVAKSGVLTGGLVDALVWAGISEEEFQAKLDACTGEQERQNLIMNTLNGTYSKASEQYQTTNKDIIESRKAQERLTDAMAELGRIGEPILSAVKNKIADLVSVAVPKLEALISKVKDVKKWIQDNQKTVNNWKAAIVGVTASVASFVLVLKFSAIMKAAKTAILGVRGAVLLLNAAMKANIIGLIVSLIIGLVAAFITLWKNNEQFRAFWINLWNKIKSACSSAVTGIKNKFNDLKDAAGRVKKWFEDIRKSIADKIESAQKSVKKAVDKIKGFFNFKWSLPKLKMPSFTMKGKFSLNPPSVPKIGINWNAAGAVFSKPTIFDTRLGLQGVGDSSTPEAVAPIGILQDYVRAAVRGENEHISQAIAQQIQALIDFLSRNMPKAVTLDSGALVGELIPGIDRELGDRERNIQRGNVR